MAFWVVGIVVMDRDNPFRLILGIGGHPVCLDNTVLPGLLHRHGFALGFCWMQIGIVSMSRKGGFDEVIEVDQTDFRRLQDIHAIPLSCAWRHSPSLLDSISCLLPRFRPSR